MRGADAKKRRGSRRTFGFNWAAMVERTGNVLRDSRTSSERRDIRCWFGNPRSAAPAPLVRSRSLAETKGNGNRAVGGRRRGGSGAPLVRGDRNW